MAETSFDELGPGDVQDLTVAVETLGEEAHLLRISLDELRDDVMWAARNILAAGGTDAMRTPRDPLAPDATFRRDEAARPANGAVVSAAAADAPETSDGSPYCCERPQLAWHGDPERPGIACIRCGYVVAEHGDVVIWRGADETASVAASETHDETPVPRQSQLFD